jgi:hypothetical protein
MVPAPEQESVLPGGDSRAAPVPASAPERPPSEARALDRDQPGPRVPEQTPAVRVALPELESVPPGRDSEAAPVPASEPERPQPEARPSARARQPAAPAPAQVSRPALPPVPVSRQAPAKRTEARAAGGSRADRGSPRRSRPSGRPGERTERRARASRSARPSRPVHPRRGRRPWRQRPSRDA